jgi:hypothetical protein
MISLTYQQLFTPAPATPQQVSTTNPGTPWLTRLMQVGTRLNLQVTDWNSGGVARTIMTCVSWMLSYEDALISGMSQGGFLDFAATGVVTYVDPTDGVTIITVPVTVDPSINPGAAPGWLDLLADSGYNVQRIKASGGVGLVTVTNTTSSAYTYQPGTYHVGNLSAGLSYSNVGAITVAAASVAGGTIASIANTSPMVVTTTGAHGLSSGDYVTPNGVLGWVGSGSNPNATYQVTVTSSTNFILNGSTGSGSYGAGGKVYVAQAAQFAADVVGPGTSSPGSITNAITAIPGISVVNLVPLIGTAAESNVALVARCRLGLAARSPNGAAAAFRYFSLTSYQTTDNGGANPDDVAVAAGALQLISQPITQVLVELNEYTGTVQTVVANAEGPVSGVVDLPVTGATNASPIVVSTSAFVSSQIASGTVVSISGVEGNAAANGTWIVSVLSSTTFALNGSTGDGAYTGGGGVEAGDLGELDAFLQTQCVPGSVTAKTLTSTSVPVAVKATIYVTAAFAGQARAAVGSALASYQSTFPIGGLTLPGEGTSVLPFDAVLGVIESSLSAIQNVFKLNLNGGTADISMAPFGQPAFGIPDLTIVGV